MQYAIAATEAQRRDVILLHCHAVIDRGWVRPDDLLDGLERDTDQDRADFAGVRAGKHTGCRG